MSSKNAAIFSVILLSFIISDVSGWRTFWKGRRSGGNLVHPEVNVTKNELPPDQWFEQKLDHFNESNKETWKQVSVN